MAAHLGFTVQNKSFWGFCLYVASARAHAEPCWAWSYLAAIQQRMSRLIFSSCQIHFNIANTMLVGISRQIAASPTSPISPQCQFSTINSLVYSVEWRHVFVAKTMSDSNYIVVKDHFFLSYILSRFLFFLSFFFCVVPLGTRPIHAIDQSAGEGGPRNGGHRSLDWTNTEAAHIAVRLSSIAIDCCRFASEKVQSILDGGQKRRGGQVRSAKFININPE